MESADVKRLKMLEQENARLKKLLAESALDIQVLKEINAKNVWSASAMSQFVLNEPKVAAPEFGCYATFKCCSSSLGIRLWRAPMSVGMSPQPFSARKRSRASLRALATHLSTICPSRHRFTLWV
jgi:hypothetical protein